MTPGKTRGTLLVAAALFTLGACGGNSSSSSPSSAEATSVAAATTPAGGSVTVFAASSLTSAFTDIGKAYEAKYPASKVTLSFAASSDLVTQIDQGAPADVFASADVANMKKLADGTVGDAPLFATNRLQVIVPAGNPKGILTVADLAKPGIVYVTASPDVPIGKYAQEVLDKAGVKVTPKSLEANVKAIVTKVTLGEADAGIVYTTDVLAAGAKAVGVDIPVDVNVVAQYPIGVPAKAPHAAAGSAFIAFVLSPDGQAILRKYGFGAP